MDQADLSHPPQRDPGQRLTPARRRVRPLRWFMLVFAGFFLLPLAVHAAWWQAGEHPPSWSAARWSSAGLLPAAAASPEAAVYIFAGRVGRWRGIVAHHTWIVVKEAGAGRYTRYDKVGWGSPVRTDGWAADGRWFGNDPEVVAAVTGRAAEALIPRINAAIAAYPYRQMGDYRVWPGPNSNTFVSHVLTAVPELDVALPPTALGKDWPEGGFQLGLSPSRTGLRLSLAGVFGVTVAWVEGLEVNLLGLVSGIDIRHPAVKLPGFGRIGLDGAVS